MTDSEIIELYMQRDERAIAETQKLYGNYCEKIARNILGNYQDAQECVNDTYLKAWDSIPPHKPRIFAAFLAKIARNTALSMYRRTHADKRGSGTVPLILDELGDIIADGTDVSQNFDDRELIAAINRFLDELPEKNRKAFILRFVCCESVRGIARQMGFSENNISVTLNRTKKLLKQHLKKEGYL